MGMGRPRQPTVTGLHKMPVTLRQTTTVMAATAGGTDLTSHRER